MQHNVSHNLWPLLHYAQLDPEYARKDSKHTLHYPTASEDHRVCYSPFPSELSSGVGFNKPWHQGINIYAYDEDPLDPPSTHNSLHSALTQANSTSENDLAV